ncbi:MAG: arginine--tRNA ligase [Nanoarchaeota archaeon]
MKEMIVELLEKELKDKIKRDYIKNLIETPPTDELGDYAFPCFSLAKAQKKNPLLIAENIAENLRKNLPTEIQGVDSKAGYVNFFINKKILAEKNLKEASKKDFGKSKIGKNKKIVIDMSSPNIAKPFGIGHLRSTIIGNSISRICEFQGYKTIKINYLGDWGTQFGKLIVGYKKFGSEKNLKQDPIKHLLEIYVKANNEEYEQEARDWFKKLEHGDKEALSLWKKFRELSLKDFEKVYSFLNIKFDLISGESFYNKQLKDTIKELERKNLLKESDGAKIIDLEKFNLGVCLIQKSDETSLYATRDITAVIDRYKKYNFEKMLYEVGQEQSLHFKQIFRILELMGFDWAEKCVHIEHGLYLDSDGKKFATRKGKTIFMQDILNETLDLARKELEKRYKLSKNEIEERAKKIAIAAIFYGDLKNYRTNNMIFDINKFLEFEGNTGPYLLYSYARASSILKKSKSKKENKKIKIIDLKEQEIKLLKKISAFPKTTKDAYEKFAPNIIANYSYELAQAFNEFYHSCEVLGSSEETFRLKLVEIFRNVIKNSLWLLGIDVLEEM